ncbi:MAG: sugar transferase [Paracoccaceae bacterium]
MFHYSKVNGDVVSPGRGVLTTGSVPEPTFYGEFLKRFFDIFLIVVFTPVVLPLILLAALVIGRDGASPFYEQPRVGRNGKTFTCWKLRTMVADADERLERYLAENPSAREEWNATQKLKSDPRVTRIGRFLRMSSLDELPQLYNVLRGEMSLVGPRPMMPEQMSLYPGDAYYSLRPGITGLWQISDRNECSFSERAEFDTKYARALSFSLDLSILMKTVGVVFRATGY